MANNKSITRAMLNDDKLFNKMKFFSNASHNVKAFPNSFSIVYTKMVKSIANKYPDITFVDGEGHPLSFVDANDIVEIDTTTNDVVENVNEDVVVEVATPVDDDVVPDVVVEETTTKKTTKRKSSKK